MSKIVGLLKEIELKDLVVFLNETTEQQSVLYNDPD